MAGKIKTLFSDKEKTEPLFPRTKTSAVSADDGTGLDVLLEHVGYYDDSDGTGASVPVDADSLGGLPAENYATQAFVTNKIAEAQVGGGDAGSIDLSGYVSKDDVIDIAHGGHGGTTAVEALANLGALNLAMITDDAHMIASGDDLNSYTTLGAYRCATGAIADSLLNSPTDYSAGFRLLVSSTSTAKGLVQIAIYNSVYNYVYMRIRNDSGTWGNWAQYITSAGGTMNANLTFNPTTPTSFVGIQAYRKKSADTAETYMSQFGTTTTPGAALYLYKDSGDGNGNVLQNQLTLTETKTTLKKPLDVASGGTGATSAANARTNLGAKMKLLWTNASPTSTFESFTPLTNSDLAESLANFTAIMIWFNNTPEATQHSSFIIPIGIGSGASTDDVENATLCFTTGDNKWVRRYCWATTSAVTFGTGGFKTSLSADWTVNSKYMVPERIYGIR